MSFTQVLLPLLVVGISITAYALWRLTQWTMNQIGLRDAPAADVAGQGGLVGCRDGAGRCSGADDGPPPYVEVMPSAPGSPADEQPPSFAEAVAAEERRHTSQLCVACAAAMAEAPQAVEVIA